MVVPRRADARSPAGTIKGRDVCLREGGIAQHISLPIPGIGQGHLIDLSENLKQPACALLGAGREDRELGLGPRIKASIAGGGAGNLADNGRRWNPSLAGLVVQNSKGDLFEIILALRAACHLAGRLHRRQE